MDLKTLSEQKGKTVYTINENDLLSNCVKILNEHHIGVLVVVNDNNDFAGIVSERDIMRVLGEGRIDFWTTPVKQMMTPRDKIFSVQSSESLESVMKLMTEKRIRHIPVMENNKIQGIISIGDVVKNIVNEVSFHNEQLRNYITGSL